MSESPQPYRVLARKYRPQRFADLIGQEAMVKTLANAIARDRLAHAFLLTGVRGVGKTSTARLIAKALNCVGPDGEGGPTIDPCGMCEPCRAIAAGRHIDVIEMDAASNTGVDNVREIIEAVRYAAVSARYKIYIVDEVHMLSKSAFNALLKTLEEPPQHVKFLFATTEVDKVPVTVLSRCQRFDLRRIPADLLVAHFGEVAKAEGAEIEGEALALIAGAAEGSARDGLSILDQAIAHGGGAVTAAQVRAMLGLSDRGAVRDLLGLLLAGDAPGALARLKEQYDLGVEPAALLRGLLEAVHGIARAKVGGAIDPAQSDEERAAYADWAARLGFGVIHRLWQMLLKGLGEIESAPAPFEAAEMALLRIIYAAELPDPGELAARIAGGEGAAGGAGAAAAPATAAGSRQGPLLAMPPDFPAMIALLESRGHHRLALQLHDQVGLVRYAPAELDIRPAKPLAGTFARDVAAALRDATGTPWRVRLVEDGEAQPTLREQELAAEAAVREGVRNAPVVRAALAAFPEAELVGYELADKRSA